MKKLTRFSLIGLLLAAIGGLIFGSNVGVAGDDKLAKQFQAIADAVEKGDKEAVAKLSDALAKQEEEVYYVMLLLKPRSKKGVGVGPTPNEIIPDGIELKLRDMARNVMSKVKLKREKDALIEMAYRLSGLGHFAGELPPLRDKGKATKKYWMKLSEELQKESLELVKAIKTESPAEVKKAASKVNTNCNQCHAEFR